MHLGYYLAIQHVLWRYPLDGCGHGRGTGAKHEACITGPQDCYLRVRTCTCDQVHVLTLLLHGTCA
jgi:hypothetical protein